MAEKLALFKKDKQHPQFNFLPYANFSWAGTSFLVESKET